MKPVVQLDSKDVRTIIARFLNIPITDVIPNRYNFGIVGLSAEEIDKRIKGEAE